MIKDVESHCQECNVFELDICPVSSSKIEEMNLSWNTNVKACEGERACRWCSWSGFVNFKKQNRELPYASERRASR
jgi:ribosomal protein S11